MHPVLKLLAVAGLALALSSGMAQAADPVNVNTATAEEISESLKGIGLSKAQAIVAYREANGPFRHIDELVNVKGVGIRTVDQNRNQILLGDAAGAAD